MKKALDGHYSERYLLLKENLRLREEHRQSVRNMEKQIEALPEEMGMQKQDIYSCFSLTPSQSAD